MSKILTQILDRSVALAAKERLVEKVPDSSKSNSKCITIAGNSGVGKSSLIREMILKLREQEELVAVLAIDPSSEFSGGALLGDRIRFIERDLDLDLFIRSVACGSIDHEFMTSIKLASQFLLRVGFQSVFIETPGLGQLSNIFSRESQCLALIISPFNGDEIQMMKSGILEEADLIFINRSDQMENLSNLTSIVETLKIARESRYSSNSIIIGSAKERINIDEFIFQWRTCKNKNMKLNKSKPVG